MRIAFLVAASFALAACTTYEDDLARGQRAFEQSEHERALAVLRALEPDTGHLSFADLARYAYLRGMTDFRIGYKVDARHWLGMAAAMQQQAPGSIPPDWAKRMNESLKELNEEVYQGGYESLTSNAATKSKDATEDTESDAPRESRARVDKKTNKKNEKKSDDE